MKTCPMFLVIVVFTVEVNHLVLAHPTSEVKSSPEDKPETDDVQHITLPTEDLGTNSTGSAINTMETNDEEIIILETISGNQTGKNGDDSTFRNAKGTDNKFQPNAHGNPEEVVIFEFSPPLFTCPYVPHIEIEGPANMHENPNHSMGHKRRHRHGHHTKPRNLQDENLPQDIGTGSSHDLKEIFTEEPRAEEPHTEETHADYSESKPTKNETQPGTKQEVEQTDAKSDAKSDSKEEVTKA